MKKFQKSIEREKELVKSSLKKGKIAYRLEGKGIFNVVEIDPLDKKVTFTMIRANPGDTFKIDRDIKVYSDFTLVTRRVTYDGMVDD